jgi:acyl carrier protein
VNLDEANEVIGRILSRIAPEISISSVPTDALLQEELDLDSMDFLNFVGGLLEETGVDVPERDYPQLQSLEGCARYLVAHAE